MSQWQNICKIDDILPGTGVRALSGGEQVGDFPSYHSDRCLRSANIDPFFLRPGKASLTDCEHRRTVVASPLKSSARLERWFLCMEDA
ncbi:nitrite reductase (NAD(P)H) small subunit [Salmonella enterica subsp. enterica]|nr:nitrite reductase (NAD(P)H) small subunit [Salmonella enterica subsp. enterica]